MLSSKLWRVLIPDPDVYVVRVGRLCGHRGALCGLVRRAGTRPVAPLWCRLHYLLHIAVQHDVTVREY